MTFTKIGFLVRPLELNPVGWGEELDGSPAANIVVKVPTLFFLSFFFPYCPFFLRVFKDIFRIISAAD